MTLHMNDAQSFLDKISDAYYPGSKYPLANIPKHNSFGLCEIANKLSVPISINHLKTKSYIIIIATESVFKCITNYLCKEQVFLITESNIHTKDNAQSSCIYLIHYRHTKKSQNMNNLTTKLIYSESQFTNLVDIINIPINAVDNDNEDLFDILLNSSHIFVYYLPSYGNQFIDCIAKITKFNISIGIYTSMNDLNYVVNVMKNQSLNDKVKFIKPLTLPSELELVEYLLDHVGDEGFRKFYKNLFEVEININGHNMSDMISEIDTIMKNKCIRCYNKLENDIKLLRSPHNNMELYKKKIEFGVIGTIILLSILCKSLNNSEITLSRLLSHLVDNVVFKIIYYIALCYLLMLCAQYTDRDFFRQNESISNYLDTSELTLKNLKENYSFI